jgi:kumamolisin
VKEFLKAKFALPVVALLLTVTIVVFPFAGSITRSLAAAPSGLVTLPNSVPPQVAQAHLVGSHDLKSTIYGVVLLSPNNVANMNTLFHEQYDPHSLLYHHWLQKGEFDTLYGSTSSQMAQVKSFLSQAGLHIMSTESSTLLLVITGTAAQMAAAFHTTINNYLLPDGTQFYANASNAQIPSTLREIISGVLLTNVPSAHPSTMTAKSTHAVTSQPLSSCTYGPGTGSSFAPCQIQNIYDATPVYNVLHEQGQGVTVALFELSQYTRSDIRTYEKQFGLPNVNVQNKQVFPCLLFLCTHSGASEVELDIDMVMSLAPRVRSILVYNAPNFLGIVEYRQIADDDAAQVVSSSWGNCEANSLSVVIGYENTFFQQMAMQGQSMLAASGDNGAFDCLGDSSSENTLQVDDPGSQQYVTAVGGTSLYGAVFDPNWDYPTGQETVWNDNCTPKTCYGKNGGGGGGVSRTWSMPISQTGPGVIESGYSQYGSWCGQSSGTACREVPDVSINADPFSGYDIYCTDKGDSFCSKHGGWINSGGTSAAAPLWAAITALMDNYAFGGFGIGMLTPLLYSYDSTAGYCAQFHDIAVSGTNGHYPTEPNYDMATGLGTPDIYYLVDPSAATGCSHQTGVGHLWLTGHDADYHCSVDGSQCHYLQVALNYVMNGSTLPVLALDHGTEVATAISDAFGSSAPTVDTVDPRSGFAGLPLVSSTGTPLYSAIVVASDITCGGCDNNNGFGDTPDSDAINARSADIATYVNAGGGILALAGAENIAVFYNFVPTPVTGEPTTSPYTLTTLGLSLGLIEGQDDNCCPTHNSFQLPGTGSPLQVAETDAAGLAETLVAQGPFALSTPRPTPTQPSKPPVVPTNKPK